MRYIAILLLLICTSCKNEKKPEPPWGSNVKAIDFDIDIKGNWETKYRLSGREIQSLVLLGDENKGSWKKTIRVANGNTLKVDFPIIRYYSAGDRWGNMDSIEFEFGEVTGEVTSNHLEELLNEYRYSESYKTRTFVFKIENENVIIIDGKRYIKVN